MSDPTLIADLIRAGVDPELIGRVANAMIAVATPQKSGGNSAEIHTDSQAERRRAKDRERYQLRRKSAESAENPQKSAETVNQPLNEVVIIDPPKKEKQKKESKSTGRRISAEWEPGEAGLEFAASKGMPQQMVDLETEKFKNYWAAKSGEKGLKLDWPATWRNWVISWHQRNPQKNGGADPRGERGVDWW